MIQCRSQVHKIWTNSQGFVSQPRHSLSCKRRMTTLNQVQRPDERVQIVDESNNPLGSATRAEMRAKNLIHRCSFTMVFNPQGELYVQKRVAFKETYPSHYDPAPGGVVGAGERYEENAEREIAEEMGITAVELQKQFDFFYSDDVSRLWGRLFTTQYDGDIRLDPEEVESGQFMSMQEVAHLLRSALVCPDSKVAVENYLQKCAPELL